MIQDSQPLPNLERPTIVCLCGSTRFFDTFSKLNLEQSNPLDKFNESKLKCKRGE